MNRETLWQEEGRHDSDVAAVVCFVRPSVRPSARLDGRTSITPNHDLNNFGKKRRDKNEPAGKECGNRRGV